MSCNSAAPTSRRSGTSFSENPLTTSGGRKTLARIMASREHFAGLLGKIMLNCGMLEFLTTLHIDWLGHDSLLSDEIVDFGRRIDVLSKLLHKRTRVPAKEIKSLCDQLKRIARGRNEIAHNPIWEDNKGDFYIMVVRRMTDLRKDKRVREKDLNVLLNETREALAKMHALPVEPSEPQAKPPTKAGP